MRYAIDVLNSSRNKVAELKGMAAALLREKVNDVAVLTVETVDGTVLPYVTAGTSFLRLRDTGDGSARTFRVIEATHKRARERRSIAITARHILYDTGSELFADAVNCMNYTPSELAALVLGYSTFDAGTIEPETTVPFVRFEYETVLECLMRICSLTGGELSLDEENGSVDILNSIGDDNGVIFRYGLNLKAAERTVTVSRFANRIYGVGGGEPPLLLSGATSSGGKIYADDSESIAAYGLFEGVYHEPTLEEVINLVAVPAFDGTYSAGLCEQWTKTGTPTVSKNTNADHYLYGRASQRIQSTADGQGIEQAVTVTEGTVYSLSATLFITSGTVRVQVEDGTTVYRRAEPVTGSGFVTVRIENWKANNQSVTVKLFQEGSGSADFYVDSVQVAAGARARQFTNGKSADILWERTVEYLEAHKNPEIAYTIDLVDLYGDTRTGREADRFGIGDTVRVIDPTLDLDVSTRVMERLVDILRPWRVMVQLDNASRSLADVFSAMRKAQENGVKHQRAVLAESSNAAEAGSLRLGFRSQAFRFFGTISADSWNGLSWSDGTLRVGDAYYAVSSGSTTNLSGSTTYYFYFDRTDPTTLGYTTGTDDAEGDDRLLLFAATTTTQPTLCVIHPMGIIKE